jgi:hypothetical protein
MGDDWTKELPEYKGKRVNTISIGQENGYDFIYIQFDNAPAIQFMEDGQAGWCKIALGLQKYQLVGGMNDG